MIFPFSYDFLLSDVVGGGNRILKNLFLQRVDKDGDGAITRTEALNSGDTGISREIIDGIFEVCLSSE